MLHPSLHIQEIVAFVQTVEAGSFSQASERMGLTKSAAAKSVARLEERLGVQLLIRTTRSVTPTQDGCIFYEKCLGILESIDEAEALVAARQANVSGQLRVSLPLALGRLWILPILTKLARVYPDLKLDISFTDRMVDLIEERIDLAVRIGGTADSTSLMTRKLVDHHSMLCASPDYLDQYGTPNALEDLQAHRCILFAHGGRILPWRLTDNTGKRVDLTVRGQMTISHGEGILDAVRASHGIAQLADWLAKPDLETGRLIAVLPASDVRDRSINLLWPAHNVLPPKIRVAVDAIAAAFAPTAPWC